MSPAILIAPPEIATATEATHDVLMAESTRCERLGRSYRGGTEAVFNDLVRMYEVAPEYVVKPIELLHDSEGAVSGYRTEKIDGVPLSDYYRSGGRLPAAVLDIVEVAVEKLHANGLVHGDLNAGNILLTSDGGIKLIDPVGFGEIPAEEFKTYADLDYDRFCSALGNRENAY